jgi:hypothetical protein
MSWPAARIFEGQSLILLVSRQLVLSGIVLVLKFPAPTLEKRKPEIKVEPKIEVKQEVKFESQDESEDMQGA